jgi:chalcone isomerase-like protein
MLRLLTLLALTLPVLPAAAQQTTTKPADGTATKQEAAPTAKPNKAPTVKEPSSGLPFPTWLMVGPKGKRAQHALSGLGIRKKTIFRVKVYAYGLYIDVDAARAHMKPFMSKTTKQLLKDRNFDRALASDKFGKSLRLVMARDVDADDMEEAFEDALKPRMKRYLKKASDEDRANGTAALKKFQGYFTKELEKKHELIFTWLPGGYLHTTIQGKKMPVIQDVALVWALFDVYLGEDPISDDGKENIVKALPKVLKEAKQRRSGGAGGR